MFKLSFMRRFFQYFFAVLLFCLAFWGVTYTADWAGYEVFFNRSVDIKDDIGSVFIFNLLKDYGFNDYQIAFRVHIVLMSILFPFVFIKLGLNPIPYTIILVVLSYVPLANQIRYYVAFPAMLLFIIFFSEKKYLISVAFGLVAILFHRTTIILGALLLIYYLYSGKTLNNLKHKKYILLGLSGSTLLMLFMYSRLGSALGNYSYYTTDSQTSSIIGGIFNLLPCLLGITTILYFDQRIKKFHQTVISYNYCNYRLLLVFSIATCILMPLSLRMQVLNTRMIIRFSPFWIAYLVYIQSTGKRIGQNVKTSLAVILFIVFSIIHQTVLPYRLGIEETPIPQELILTLSSYHL